MSYRWLQKGSQNANSSFFRDLSKALGLLIITARNRFISSDSNFSLIRGIKAWAKCAFDLIDIFIGLPRFLEHSKSELDFKVRLEMQKFLVSDLKVDETQVEIYEEMCKRLLAVTDCKVKAIGKGFNSLKIRLK